MPLAWFVVILVLLPLYVWTARMALIDEAIKGRLRLSLAVVFIAITLVLASELHAVWSQR